MLEPYPKVESQDVARDDLEGTYEILKENRLIILRYLNFVTYSDTENNTPDGYRYFVKLLCNGQEIKSNIIQPIEIRVDHKTISDSGGTFIFQIPQEILKDLRQCESSDINYKE